MYLIMGLILFSKGIGNPGLALVWLSMSRAVVGTMCQMIAKSTFVAILTGCGMYCQHIILHSAVSRCALAMRLKVELHVMGFK